MEEIEVAKIKIRFLASFCEKENWEIEVPINSGDKLGAVFEKLPRDVYKEIWGKILQPTHPRFAVAVNGIMIKKEDIWTTTLTGGEKITLFARLVGG